MISPLAHGLFHAAIAQSGGDMGPTRTPEGLAILRDAEKSGVAFAATLGAKSIDQLRRLPAKTIASAKFDGLPEIPHSNAALPIMDGYVIPDDTYTLYAAGKQAPVPLLIGYNRNEGAYIFRPIEAPAYVAATRRTYGALADQFLALYPASPETESARSQTRLWAESGFGWQVWAWARAHAKSSGRKVFFYYFSDEQVAHGAELPYVFLEVRRPERRRLAALAGVRPGAAAIARKRSTLNCHREGYARAVPGSRGRAHRVLQLAVYFRH